MNTFHALFGNGYVRAAATRQRVERHGRRYHGAAVTVMVNRWLLVTRHATVAVVITLVERIRLVDATRDIITLSATSAPLMNITWLPIGCWLRFTATSTRRLFYHGTRIVGFNVNGRSPGNTHNAHYRLIRHVGRYAVNGREAVVRYCCHIITYSHRVGIHQMPVVTPPRIRRRRHTHVRHRLLRTHTVIIGHSGINRHEHTTLLRYNVSYWGITTPRHRYHIICRLTASGGTSVIFIRALLLRHWRW